VCVEFLQVGELFTAQQQPQQQAGQGATNSTDNSSSGSLLQAVLQEDEADISELYFGSAEGPAGGSSSPEAISWKQRSQAFSQQLAPLQQTQVRSVLNPAYLSQRQRCIHSTVSVAVLLNALVHSMVSVGTPMTHAHTQHRSHREASKACGSRRGGAVCCVDAIDFAPCPGPCVLTAGAGVLHQLVVSCSNLLWQPWPSPAAAVQRRTQPATSRSSHTHSHL
jgi:hypothetical protein